jgi:hypothetical protein
MLAQVALRAEEEGRAVERSSVAFDDAHDEVNRMIARGRCHPIDVRPWDGDRAVEVTPELIATLRRPLPDDRSEVDASRVGGHERFREDGELCPPCAASPINRSSLSIVRWRSNPIGAAWTTAACTLIVRIICRRAPARALRFREMAGAGRHWIRG